MKYQIIQIWTQEWPDAPIFAPCFKIVGEPYGYETIEDARLDKTKQPKPDNCIIIQVFE